MISSCVVPSVSFVLRFVEVRQPTGGKVAFILLQREISGYITPKELNHGNVPEPEP